VNLKKLERYLQVNLLGPGPRLMKKERRKKKKILPGRGLTKVQKQFWKAWRLSWQSVIAWAVIICSVVWLAFAKQLSVVYVYWAVNSKAHCWPQFWCLRPFWIGCRPVWPSVPKNIHGICPAVAYCSGVGLSETITERARLLSRRNIIHWRNIRGLPLEASVPDRTPKPTNLASSEWRVMNV